MDDRGVDPACIHQADGLLGGERRNLTMRHITRQAAAPEVNLGIDDLHGMLSSKSNRTRLAPRRHGSAPQMAAQRAVGE
jgi:hypothetical protein